MAYLPELRRKYATQAVTDTFRGINRNEKILDGEFAEIMNLSTREYPMLCPRERRKVYANTWTPGGILAKEKLCWTNQGHLIYDGQYTGVTVTDPAEGDYEEAPKYPKQLINFGAYVIVWPDQKYWNSQDPTDNGRMDKKITYVNLTPALVICDENGDQYPNLIIGDMTPEQEATAQYHLVPSTDVTVNPILYKKTENNTWEVVAPIYKYVDGEYKRTSTIYTKIVASNIGKHFGAGERATLSGIEAPETETNPALVAQLHAMNGPHTIIASEKDWIAIEADLNGQYTQQNGTFAEFSAAKTIPEMDYMLEYGNRLWGCHYGEDANGKIVNEIYASKLGDFTSWYTFAGVSTDSYAVSVGSDGPFTGCVVYDGIPMFFKENCVHKIYGNLPRNYQVMTTQLRGVQKGSWRSLQTVKGVLMYLSTKGVEAYTGSLPTCISEPLGENRDLHDGVAGSLGNRYYLSCAETVNGNEKLTMYVYDMQYGIWTEETNVHAMGMATLGDALYVLDSYPSGNHIWIIEPGNTPGTPQQDETIVNWEAKTGLIGWDMGYRKRFVSQKFATRFNIRAVMPMGSRLRVYIQYNSEGPWEEKLNIHNTGDSTRTLLMPVYPRRCDHMRLKLEGEGEIKIYSIARIVSGGGDGQRGAY